MEVRKITLPNDLIIPELISWLSEKSEVTLKAAGRSMHPYIKDRVDDLIITSPDRQALKVGDVVLALTDDDRYVVHRIIKIEGDSITLKGDGNVYGTETCSRSNVHGYLKAILHNGRRIDCNTPTQRLKARLLSWLYITPRKIKHKLIKVSK